MLPGTKLEAQLPHIRRPCRAEARILETLRGEVDCWGDETQDYLERMVHGEMGIEQSDNPTWKNK